MWGYFWAFAAGYMACVVTSILVSILRDTHYWIEWDEMQERARREGNE